MDMEYVLTGQISVDSAGGVTRVRDCHAEVLDYSPDTILIFF